MFLLISLKYSIYVVHTVSRWIHIYANSSGAIKYVVVLIYELCLTFDLLYKLIDSFILLS